MSWAPEGLFLGGSTNPALVALLVSLALERSPLVAALSQQVIRGSEPAAVERLSGLATELSAFLNNTAVLGLCSGGFVRAPHDRQQPAYPSVVGVGVGWYHALVGTSTDLVVHSLEVQARLPPSGSFGWREWACRWRRCAWPW